MTSVRTTLGLAVVAALFIAAPRGSTGQVPVRPTHEELTSGFVGAIDSGAMHARADVRQADRLERSRGLVSGPRGTATRLRAIRTRGTPRFFKVRARDHRAGHQPSLSSGLRIVVWIHPTESSATHSREMKFHTGGA